MNPLLLKQIIPIILFIRVTPIESLPLPHLHTTRQTDNLGIQRTIHCKIAHSCKDITLNPLQDKSSWAHGSFYFKQPELAFFVGSYDSRLL
jgi:hypothetical protein